jgi:hypothetical protein
VIRRRSRLCTLIPFKGGAFSMGHKMRIRLAFNQDAGEVRLLSLARTAGTHSPAIIISEILSVGATVEDRQARSLPIISIDMNMSLRLPAIVISSTG